jgi:hypothetical protein
LAEAHPRLAQEQRDKEEAELNRRYQGENPADAQAPADTLQSAAV